MAGNYSKGARYFIDRQNLADMAQKEAGIMNEKSKSIQLFMVTPYKSAALSKAAREEISTCRLYMDRDHDNIREVHKELLLRKCRKRSAGAVGPNESENERGHLEKKPRIEAEHDARYATAENRIIKSLEEHARLNNCLTKPSEEYLEYKQQKRAKDEGLRQARKTGQEADLTPRNISTSVERCEAKVAEKIQTVENRMQVAGGKITGHGFSQSQLEYIRERSRRALESPEIYQGDLKGDTVNERYGGHAADAARRYLRKKASAVEILRHIESMMAEGTEMPAGLELEPLSAIPMRTRHLYSQMSD